MTARAARPDTTPWLTPEEAAGYGRIAPSEVYLALRNGELRGYQRKVKGHWRIHREDLDAWIRGEIRPVEIPVVTRRGRG